MKKTKLLMFALAFLTSIGSIGQEIKQEPWNNHENYKEEILNNIKKGQKFNIIDTEIDSELDLNESNEKSTSRTFPDFEFVNGVNIAWVNFGNDIGLDNNGTQYHPDLNRFSSIMDQVKNAGGNVIRWWFHTNGSSSPVFYSNGYVNHNPAYFKTDLLSILNLAASKGIKIQICLWSFDMLKGGQYNVNSARNKKILTSDSHLQAYLNNSLIPLVNAVGNHPGLYAWEIFNEPEGMTTQYAGHWAGFTDRVTMYDIQKTINRTVSAIKYAQPNVKVTSGALGFTSCVDKSSRGYINQYSDQKLIAAGGKSNGVLDFYNIHYYDWAGTDGSPFHMSFQGTNLDKPTVIAEYYPINTFGVSSNNLGTTLIQKNWNGSMLWSITDKPWNDIRPVMQNISQALQNNNSSSLSCTDVTSSTNNFVIRNSWSDQNIGSYLNNNSINLKVTHRQWGKTDLSLITNQQYPIQAGKQYVISFDFIDNSNSNLNRIEVGFANGYNTNGAILSQSSVNSSNGFSPNFKTHTATITSSNAGQKNLSLKLVWNNSPNQETTYYIRNIKICEKNNSSKFTEDISDIQVVENDIKVYPNPSSGLFNITLPANSNLKIYNVNGQLVKETENPSVSNVIDLQSSPKGIYLIKISNNGNDFYRKIIVE